MPPAPRPRIVPVIDVMGGQVVRAVGGRRSEYRPLVSRLTGATDIRSVASALLRTVRPMELYLADLDAIAGGELSPAVREFVAAKPPPVWLDGGFRTIENARPILKNPFVRPVLGFETLHHPGVVAEFVSGSGRRPVALSIDQRDGELVGDWRAWGLAGPGDGIGLAARAVGLGVRTLVVIDLARVGTGSGSGTEDLLRAIRAEFPEVELIAGGGVRDWANVDRLGEAGTDAVLVASALHDGSLTFPRPG